RNTASWRSCATLCAPSPHSAHAPGPFFWPKKLRIRLRCPWARWISAYSATLTAVRFTVPSAKARPAWEARHWRWFLSAPRRLWSLGKTSKSWLPKAVIPCWYARARSWPPRFTLNFPPTRASTRNFSSWLRTDESHVHEACLAAVTSGHYSGLRLVIHPASLV